MLSWTMGELVEFWFIAGCSGGDETGKRGKEI